MNSRVRRAFAALFLAGAVAVPLVAAPTASAAKSRYAVVVVHANESVAEQCVKLTSDKVKALALLNATDFDLYTTAYPGLGRSICYLDGEGTLPPDGCFDFDGDGDGDPNWGIWLERRGEPAPSQQSDGVSLLNIPAGSVVYFQYDPFGGPDFQQDPPAERKFRSICDA